MPRPTTSAAHRSIVPTSPRVPLAAVIVGLLCLAATAGGILLLAMHTLATATQAVLVPAGVVLLACALFLGRAARTMWRRGDGLGVFKPWLNWSVAGRIFLGLFACYALALAVGPARYLEYGLLAAVVAWLTLVLLPLAAAPDASKSGRPGCAIARCAARSGSSLARCWRSSWPNSRCKEPGSSSASPGLPRRPKRTATFHYDCPLRRCPAARCAWRC